MSSLTPGRALALVGGAAAVAASIGGPALAGGGAPRTAITIKRAAEPSLGGESYGGDDAGSGYVTQERSIDLAADGVVRFPGVAATLDAATVEFTSQTDPGNTHVVEQRLVNDLINPEALLLRQLGKPVTVVLATGELTGTLRAVSSDALVLDTGDRGAHIVPRGPQVLGVKLAATTVDQEPTLEWRLASARAGKHDVTVSYRADGLAWQPDYSVVIGDDGTIDLSAWATITNDTGTDFTDAEVTLTAGGGAGVFPSILFAATRPATSKPQSWKVASAVTLRAGQPVQVELAPRKTKIKPRETLMFAPLDERAGQDSATPATDCGYYLPPASRVGSYLEVDVGTPLPSGKVRLLRRTGAELTVIGTDELRASGGIVRIAVATSETSAITGERNQVGCQPDGSGRSLREDLELTVTNDGPTAADVLVREYMYRWHHWKIVKESQKGTRAERAQEYRLKIPAGQSRTVSLTVQYDW